MDIVKRLKEFIGWHYPPLKLYPEDVDVVIRDYRRMHRYLPEVDSECIGHARTMFFLRTYTGVPEFYDADTSEGRVSRLVLFKRYKGRPERLGNLDIHPENAVITQKAQAATSK